MVNPGESTGGGKCPATGCILEAAPLPSQWHPQAARKGSPHGV